VNKVWLFGYGVALYGLHLDPQGHSSKTGQRKIVHNVEVYAVSLVYPSSFSHADKRFKLPSYVIGMLCTWHHVKIDGEAKAFLIRGDFDFRRAPPYVLHTSDYFSARAAAPFSSLEVFGSKYRDHG
jgi:hypothetical protein